jgi:hypothetical protein
MFRMYLDWWVLIAFVVASFAAGFMVAKIRRR